MMFKFALKIQNVTWTVSNYLHLISNNLTSTFSDVSMKTITKV